MNYKYLVTNGCSFVQGDGYRYPDFLTNLKPPHRFSKLLSDKLKCEDINLAQSGASNDRIIRTTFDWIENNKHKCKDTLLILGLTDPSRVEFYLNEINEYVDSHLSTLGDNHIGPMEGNTGIKVPTHITSLKTGRDRVLKWLMFYLQYFYSDKERVEKIKREITLLLPYLKENKVDLIIFNSLGFPYTDARWGQPDGIHSITLTDFLRKNTNFLSFDDNYLYSYNEKKVIDSWNELINGSYQTHESPDEWLATDGHPGKDAHKWLSTYLHNYIKRGFKNV